MGVLVLLLWMVGGVAIGIWRWTSLGRMRSSVDAHERGLRELQAITRRSNPMPRGHVNVLPSETAVLRPPRKRRSAGNGDRLGISA